MKEDHDYNYAKEEFLNPIVIKMPDGSLNIGTESKDKQIVRFGKLNGFRKKFCVGSARVGFCIKRILTRSFVIIAMRL